MTSNEKKQIIENMVDRLSVKLAEYHEYMERDEIFEVKKKLRMEIKQLSGDIEVIKQKQPDDITA